MSIIYTSSDKARFITRFTVNKDGCWKWIASIRADGYGQFYAQKTTRTAHRVSYEMFRDPIPKNQVIDHLCNNKDCVNPLHLEVVSNRENLMRADGFASLNNKKTHCINGHKFTIWNTYVTKDGKHRYCRMCRRDYKRLNWKKYYYKNKEK